MEKNVKHFAWLTRQTVLLLPVKQRPQWPLPALKPKLHLCDLLWICCTTSCTTNPQKNPQHRDMSRCCGFAVDSTANPQVHNKSNFSGVWISTSWGLVVVLQPITASCCITWRRTSLYVIYNSQNEVVDENAKFLQFSTASLIDAYHNEPTLWESNLNAKEEEKELAWFRLSSTFNTPAGLTCLMYVNHRCNKLYCPVITVIPTVNLTQLLT